MSIECQAKDRWVTVRSLAVAAAILGSLHAWCEQPTIHRILQQGYHDHLYGLLSHRMCEAIVAVASFTAAAALFSFIEYFGFRKLHTALLKTSSSDAFAAADGASGSRNASSTSSSSNGAPAPRQILRALASDALTTLSFAVSTETEAQPAVLSSPITPFVFWLAMNVGLYLGLIDLSQRILGNQLASLHHADEDIPSVLRVVTEVMFSVWAYDFIFWWVHRSWHATGSTVDGTGDDDGAARKGNNRRRPSWKNQLLKRWRAWHLLHHDYYEATDAPLHPMSTFHHHFMDASLQVGINIIVQQLPLAFLFPGARHKVSKVIHNIVVTYLLIEAHSGFDLPFMSHRLFPSLFGGSVRHQIHHQSGKVYYHQFFKYLDDWYYRAAV